MYEQEKFAWQYAEQHSFNLNTVSLPTLTEKTVIKYLYILSINK